MGGSGSCGCSGVSGAAGVLGVSGFGSVGSTGVVGVTGSTTIGGSVFSSGTTSGLPGSSGAGRSPVLPLSVLSPEFSPLLSELLSLLESVLGAEGTPSPASGFGLGVETPVSAPGCELESSLVVSDEDSLTP